MVDLYETLTRSRALLITLNVRKNLSAEETQLITGQKIIII